MHPLFTVTSQQCLFVCARTLSHFEAIISKAAKASPCNHPTDYYTPPRPVQRIPALFGSMDVSSHYQSAWLRQLPHYRTCLPGIGRSCNVISSPSPSRARRIAFLAIMILRTVETLLFATVFYMHALKWFIFGLPVTLAVFVFVAWNLHLIVEAEGERQLSKLRIPGAAFTVFLWIVLVVHVFLVGLEVTGLSYFTGGTRMNWFFWILLICFVAWVAGRDSDEGSLTLA